MPQLSMQSPVGALTVSAEDGVIVSLDWGWGRDQERSALLREAVSQLNDYFDGERGAFDLPLAPSPTAAGAAIRQAVATIPYGAIVRISDIAARIGTSSAATGRARRANPLPLLIPFHRLIRARPPAADADGIDEIDRTLRALERAHGFPPSSSAET